LTVLIATIAIARPEIERATRSPRAELADLKATLAELRLVLANDWSKPLDLPQLPRSHTYDAG